MNKKTQNVRWRTSKLDGYYEFPGLAWYEFIGKGKAVGCLFIWIAQKDKPRLSYILTMVNF